MAGAAVCVAGVPQRSTYSYKFFLSTPEDVTMETQTWGTGGELATAKYTLCLSSECRMLNVL